MRFTELSYFLLLVVALAVSRVVRRSTTLGVLWLLAVSLYFYACWEPEFLVLVVVSTLLDYSVGAALGNPANRRSRKLLLGFSIVGNLGMLAVFKYGDFLLDLVSEAAAALGHPLALPRLGIALPIGISFYSFQTLSYSIDVYRRKQAPVGSLPEFALFVCFFPQLVAGPIVRAGEFLPQVREPGRPDAGRVGEGLVLICIGLVKKIVLGDQIGRALVEPFFAAPGHYNGPEALLSNWSSYFALYCDFSGYTDIALGSALLFGFVLPTNFDRPAFAASPAEHWRRWHMTLGTFLRDYLYFPLGGSRGGPVRQWWNLFLVFFVAGIWHGVGLSYVVMGIYNGVLAATWRLVRPNPSPRPWVRGLECLLAFQLTAFSVACLRPISLARLGEAAAALLRWDAPAGGLFNAWAVGWLAVAIGLHLSPRGWKAALCTWGREAPALALATLGVATGGLCALYAAGTRDFYYFQF